MMMTKHYRFCGLFAAFLFLGFMAAPALAQRCDVTYEELVKLRDPEYGAYNIWDTVHGEVETHEAFRSGLTLPSGNVLALGERYKDDEPDPEIFFIEIGRAGKVLWEKKHQIAGLRHIVKMLPHPKGTLVLANRQQPGKRSVIWVGIFDFSGELLSQREFSGRNGKVEAQDIALSVDGKTYAVVASLQANEKDERRSALFYRMNIEGVVYDQRGLMPGPDNVGHGIAALDDGGFMASGYVTEPGGRKSGWLIRFDAPGDIVWQQTYPRGAGAELVAGQTLAKDYFVTVGTAAPFTPGDNRGGWIMVVDLASGTTGWQRFLTGSLHFAARDVMVSKDGLITAIFEGDVPTEPKSPDLQTHIRMITLNPRGVMFDASAFFNGKGVNLAQMIAGSRQERILIGDTNIAHVIEKEPPSAKMMGPFQPGKEPKAKDSKEPPEIVVSQEGWVVAIPAMEPYDDPCKIKMTTLP